jgi:hypothetical protein
MSNQKLRQGLVNNGSWLVADLMMLLSYMVFLPNLSAFFGQKSYFHGGLVTLVYIIFCASVVLIRKLPSVDSKRSDYSRGWLAFFAVNFGIFISYVIAETAGFFSKLDSLPGTIEGTVALLVLAGFILWLLLAFLYMIVVLVKIKPYKSLSNSGILQVEFLGILGINLMILTVTAFWNAYFKGIEPYEGLAIGGKILIFLVTYIFFLLFFAPPRMLFLLKKSNNFTWLTFLLQTGYFVWDSLSRLAW